MFKTFRPSAASDFRGGLEASSRGFFSQNWEESGCANRSPYGKLCRNTAREKAGESGGAKIKSQIFTNLYQKFEDFKGKNPLQVVIKICIMPEGKHCMGKPYPYGAPSYLYCVTEG